MATFVLVHGAFLGGWAWRHVRRLLAEAGHEVWTPTLTGAGERAHLLSPKINLSTHIDDVANVILYEELRGVILVGHSYAGMVITGVADRIPERIAHLVYLEAAAPTSGQNATGAFADGTAAVLSGMSEGNKESWLLPPLPLDAVGITRPEDVAWASDKRVPHPLLALQQPLHLQRTAPPPFPRTYIHCTQREPIIKLFGADPLQPFSDRARAGVDGWRYRTIDAPHDVMIAAPAEAARHLLEIAT